MGDAQLKTSDGETYGSTRTVFEANFPNEEELWKGRRTEEQLKYDKYGNIDSEEGHSYMCFDIVKQETPREIVFFSSPNQNTKIAQMEIDIPDYVASSEEHKTHLKVRFNEGLKALSGSMN